MRLIISIVFISIVHTSLALAPKQCTPKIGIKYFSPTIESYSVLKQKIASDRSSLKANNISLDSCKNYLLHMFEHEIFPHWVGTTWDYNGYTNEPGEGKLVACGYFVSTPLKHMGFNWNRFKLAQMYSKAIVETTCDDMTKYSDKMKMIEELKSRDEHLYIVGLDSHVGMLLRNEHNLYFVHSNYIGLEGPVKEIAQYSEALGHSSNFWVGTFSTEKNMNKWLDGTLFPTE